MAKEAGSTVLVIGLVFSIILLIGAIGVSIKMNSDLEKVTGDLQKKDDDLKKKDDRIKEYLREIDEARKLVAGPNSGPLSYTQYQDTILKEARTNLESILSEEWVKKEDIEQIKDPRIKEIWDKLLEFKDGQREYTNLADLYADLIMQLKAVIHIVPRLRYQRVAALELVDQERQEKERIRGEKQTEIDDLRTKLTEEQDKALEQARQFDQEKRRLTDEIDRVNKDKGRFEKIKKLEIARLESEKNTLKQRIKEIKKKDAKTFEFSGADGEVILSEPSLGYCWIDLGKNHNLLPGTIFQVFRFIKGGRKSLKGQVIVKSVEADMATCTIVEGATLQDPVTKKDLVLPLEDDPIVKGDLIRNPLFDRDEQQVFVMLGTKVTNSLYQRKELERKIEESGGKVERSISIGTDFVILLAGAEEEFADELEKAAQFGVIFMRESELLEFLSR